MKSQLVIESIFLMNDKVSKWYEDTKNVDEMLDWRPALKEWEKSVSKLFSPGSRILDIGCGLGREAFALHDLGFEVVGIDISKEVISRVKQLSADKGYKQFFDTVINSDRTILSGKELDIYIPSIKTAIEYDGYYHQRTRDRDQLKNQLCLQNGITLIRVLEPSLTSFPDCICLRRKDTTSNNSLSEVINELLVLLKVENVTINIDEDELQIRSLYVSRKEQNSLLALYPQIAEEWHPTKNGDLTPD